MFVLKDIEGIVGRQKFTQLVILSDDQDISSLNLDEINGIWNEYENSLQDKYSGSLRGLMALMDRKANLQSLNELQFRDITPQKEVIKEFEFKYQYLRAYGIKIPNGVLMLTGGYKNTQKQDLKAFRALKKQYLASLKS